MYRIREDNSVEYIAVNKDGKLVVVVSLVTGEVHVLTFWEKIVLLFK